MSVAEQKWPQKAELLEDKQKYIFFAWEQAKL